MKSYKKNFSRIFTAGFAAFGIAALLASCSNVSNASVFDKLKNSRTLNIAVSNYADVVSSSRNASSENRSASGAENASRNITPDSFDETGLDFWLYGTATNGENFGPEQVTFTGKDDGLGGKSKTVGTIEIPADAYVWEFTLAAFERGAADPTSINDMKINAVLIGYSSMDMVNGDTAKFTLSPDGLEKEASVALKLYLKDWDSVPSGYKATAGIYKLTDGSVVNDKDDVSTEKVICADISDLTNGFPTSAPAAANYSVDKMNPGTYRFKVTFENTTTHKKFPWSDILVILPGKTVDNEVAIDNLIGKLPEVPADFKAGYVDSSEDKYNGYYVTEFSWTRDSLRNENNFEIDLLELNDATATVPASDTNWETAVTTDNGVVKTFDDKFSSAIEHESGSLLACNESVQIRLELGKRYFARIRAVNYAGVSDYAYVGIGAGTANGTAFTSDTINRYRITYHLQDGEFNGTVNSKPYANETNDIVVYYCQSSTTGNTIVVPDGNTITLVYDPDGTGTVTYNWTYWKNGDSKYDTVANPDFPAYKDFKNLDLYAAYTTTAGVEIFDKKSYEIDPAWIDLVTGGTFSASTSGGTANIDTNGITEAQWTFTPTGIKNPDGSDFTDFAYDIVNFTLSRFGKTYYAKSENNIGEGGTNVFTVTMPLSGLSSGVYNVNFTARYKTTLVNYTITTTVQR